MISHTARALRSLPAAKISSLGSAQVSSVSSEALASDLPSFWTRLASVSTSARTVHQIPEQPNNPELPAFSAAGRIEGSFSVTRQPVFAVVELGPTQYKVSPDDLVYTEKLRGVDVNDKISLNRVLLLGTQSQTVIGRPFVPEASVLACVEVGTCIACLLMGNSQHKLSHHASAGAFPRC